MYEVKRCFVVSMSEGDRAWWIVMEGLDRCLRTEVGILDWEGAACEH